MREFDLNAISSMMANSTDVIYLWLLEFTHEDLTTPVRLVINQEDVVSNGELYTAIACTLDIPDSKETGISYGSLTINNINRLLIPILRSLPSKINVKATLVTQTDLDVTPPEFDDVRVELLPFLLNSVTWNETQLRGSISYENVLGRKYPCIKMDIFNAPGLFS